MGKVAGPTGVSIADRGALAARGSHDLRLWRAPVALVAGALTMVMAVCCVAAPAALGIGQVAGSPFAVGELPYSVAFSPSGGYLATANYLSSNVGVFSVNESTGALTQVTGSPFAAGAEPLSVAFSPSGGYLATANPGSGTISVLSVNGSGELKQVTGSPFAATYLAESVAFSPGGGLLATANGGNTQATEPGPNNVSVFSVNGSGELTQVKGSPFATNTDDPNSVAFSPSGGYLATADFGTGVSVFSVSGELKQVRGSPFEAGYEPNSVAFSPSGGYLAVATHEGPYLFAFNQSTGALTKVTGSPFEAGDYANSIAFSPSGGYLATANYNPYAPSGSLSVFSVNQSTGALTKVTGSRFAPGEDPSSVAFSPSGEYLATANGRSESSNNVSVFSEITTGNAPAVLTGGASSFTETEATLNATVNPEGGEVTGCEFEYGTTTSYGSSVPCASLPGSEESPVGVSASVTGLTPDTTYHFRISATTPTGTSDGSDATFKTQLVPSFTNDEANGRAFGEPTAIAVGPSGNVYVADGSRFHDRILEFNSEHQYLGQFGSPGSGPGQFNQIGGIAINPISGDLYVSDSGNDRVQQFSPEGVYETQFGSFGSGNGQLWYPSGIALDSSGDVWVLDNYNGRMEEFSPSGAYLTQWTGERKLGWATGLAVSGGNLYVSEPYNARIQEFSSSGKYERQFEEKGSGTGKSNVPYGIASEPSSGNLYVVEGASILAGASANRVQEFSPDGVFITAFGSSGLGNGQLAGPRGVAVGSAGQMFVADSGNKRIEEWVLP